MTDRQRGRRGRRIEWLPEVQPGYLIGIEHVEPEVRKVIEHKARWRKGWLFPPIVISPEDFVALEEANARVQGRWAPWPTINTLTAGGYVQRGFRSSDGEEGVTAASLAIEEAWRRKARFRDHLRRFLRAIARGL